VPHTVLRWSTAEVAAECCSGHVLRGLAGDE